MPPNAQTELQKISALLKAGKHDTALKKAIAATKRFSTNPMFPQMAGAALVCTHKYSAAAQHFHKSYKIKPDHPEFQDNLARSLIGSGQLDSAETLLNKHAATRQHSASHHHVWALLYLFKKSYQQAADAANKVLELHPGHHDALLIRGKARLELLQSKSALEDFDLLIADVPKHTEAVEGRASALLALGRAEEAKQQYIDLLKLNPTHAPYLQGMSELPNMTDQDLIDLETRIDHAEAVSARKNTKRAPNLEYARYEIATRRGRTGEAMQHLAKANAMAALNKPFDNAGAERKFATVLASTDLPTASDADVALPRPIFVIGLPRSGTTLLEMTLGAHAAVQGCGELTAVADWVTRNPAATSADGLAAYYRAQLPTIQDGVTAFVDKMPSNYEYLGHIAAAFPDAMIINVDRDPRDVALSMWRKSFVAGGLGFTNDQRHMAAEANRYRKYLNHWTSKLGQDRIYSISYEELVGDFATQIPKLAEACGLEWDAAMLMPEANTAGVRTASRFQVRQAVHTKSVRGWEAFARDIGVFIENLDDDLWAHYL